MPKQKIDAQFFLDNAKRGILNQTPAVNAVQTGIMSTPYVWGGLTNLGKAVNTAVDAVPKAKQVINHPITQALTVGNPAAQAVLAGLGTATQLAGGQKLTRTGSVDTPTPYPTEAVTETIKPSRDYEDERVSSEGVAQKGQTLGGVNNILKGFGAGELADVSTAYQSAALPATLSGVTQLEKPLVEGAVPEYKPNVDFDADPEVPYGTELPEGTKSFASTDSYTPYSTGSNPSNAQDGSSPQPDRVERLRQVAFNGADFSGDEPDNSTLVSPTQSNPMRNQIRDIYGDTSLSIAQQSAKVSALTGVYRYGGEGYANVDGKLVPSKVGSGRSLLNARGAGLDPTEFLDIPETATPAYKPDASGQSESVQEAVGLTAAPTSLSTELDAAGPNVDPVEFKKSFSKKIGLTK